MPVSNIVLHRLTHSLIHSLTRSLANSVGIYVPTLAEAILNAVDNGTYTGASLTGIAVGNGCTGSETGICGYYYTDSCDGYYYETQFLANQAFFPPELKVNISTFCDWSVWYLPTIFFLSLSTYSLASYQ